MRIEDPRQRLRESGAKTCHEQRVLRAWLQARALDSGARRHRPEDFLPNGVRALLPTLTADLAGLARVRSEHPGADGSARLLVELADGQTVESVLLPRVDYVFKDIGGMPLPPICWSKRLTSA